MIKDRGIQDHARNLLPCLKGMTRAGFGGHGELTWLDTNTRSWPKDDSLYMGPRAGSAEIGSIGTGVLPAGFTRPSATGAMEIENSPYLSARCMREAVTF